MEKHWPEPNEMGIGWTSRYPRPKEGGPHHPAVLEFRQKQWDEAEKMRVRNAEATERIRAEREAKRQAERDAAAARAEAKRDANRLGRNAGDDLGRGVAEGIRQRTRDVEQAARDLVNAADKAGRDKSKSKSPSLVWMAHGHDLGDGLVIGMRDRVGDAQDAARALIYTPRGLPGGDDLGSRGKRSGKAGGGGSPTFVINGNINLPNVRDAHEFAREVEHMMETKMRMWGVSAGRG